MGIISLPQPLMLFYVNCTDSGRWARKASVWPFHNRETGWCFVTLDKNDIANKWYNQDLQPGVLPFSPEFSLLHPCFPPKKLVKCLVCALNISYVKVLRFDFYYSFLFSHRGNLTYHSPYLCSCHICCLSGAQPSECAGEHHGEGGMPEAQALLHMMHSASQNPKDTHAFCVKYLKKSFWNFSMTTCRRKGNSHDYHDIYTERESLPNLPQVWRNWHWNWWVRNHWGASHDNQPQLQCCWPQSESTENHFVVQCAGIWSEAQQLCQQQNRFHSFDTGP